MTARNSGKLTPAVTEWSDGSYRWLYELDMYHNPSMLYIWFKYLPLVFLALCVLALLTGEIPVFLPLLVMVIFLLLLVIGYYVVAFFRHGVAYHPFYMDEQYLSVNIGDPKQIRHTFVTGRNGNYMVVAFSGITSLRTYRKWDLIDMNAGTKFQVYVRPEDYDFVLQYILEHVPERTRAKYEKRK